MPLAHWVLIAVPLALAGPANAQSTVNVDVDASAAGTPLERVWAFHGYDEINYTTTPEGRQLLSTLASAHTAPVRVRSHFLLNTGDGVPALKWGSTNVYTEDVGGNPIYDWALTDGIMDTVTAAGAFPFVEIGFMPQALSTNPIPYRNSSATMLDGGCFYPPTDYAKWTDLIRAWARHANGRYPNVSNWLWELWNEPDIGYWNGSIADFAQLYDYTEFGLHEVLPNASLGGPAVAFPGGGVLRQFLQHCATGVNAATGKIGTRLDLVTFHAKGGVAMTSGHIELNLGNQLRLHRSGFRAVATFPQFKQTPIYITEADPDGCAACPATALPENAYRNSIAYGAYEMSMMKHSLELEVDVGVKLGGVLTWAFTFPGTPYFAGYRALATNGISLPVLGAFKLLGRLSGVRMPLTSSGSIALSDVLLNGVRGRAEVDGLATLDGDTVQVLLWNYHDDLVKVPPTAVHSAIRVPPRFGPNVRITHVRVDESHGDAYTLWSSQGMPSSPSSAQVAALRQAMDPSLLMPDQIVAVASDGVVSVDFDLPRFGISLLTITPTSGVNDGGTGLSPDVAIGTDSSTTLSCPSRSGCSCVVVARDHDRATSTALGIGLVAILTILRGRNARRAQRRR